MTTTIFARNKRTYATVDDDDADLAELRWTDNRKYFMRGGNFLLHRVIMARVIGRRLESEETVDHIDGDIYNNVRSNLEIVTRAENTIRAAKRRRRRIRQYPQYIDLIRKLRWTNDWIVVRDGSFHPTEEDAVIHMRHKKFIR